MPPDVAAVARWIEKADHDLRTAEVALDLTVPIPDVAGFHCQQAVEKLLKAYLVWREVEPEKIHDLRALTLSCGRLDPEFNELLPQVAPLTAFAVRFRYPSPGDPNPDEVHSALGVVHRVRSFVLDRLPPEVRP